VASLPKRQGEDCLPAEALAEEVGERETYNVLKKTKTTLLSIS